MSKERNSFPRDFEKTDYRFEMIRQGLYSQFIFPLRFPATASIWAGILNSQEGRDAEQGAGVGDGSISPNF